VKLPSVRITKAILTSRIRQPRGSADRIEHMECLNVASARRLARLYQRDQFYSRYITPLSVSKVTWKQTNPGG
jgi:hypothetical protein